jgi:hypothetical protein
MHTHKNQVYSDDKTGAHFNDNFWNIKYELGDRSSDDRDCDFTDSSLNQVLDINRLRPPSGFRLLPRVLSRDSANKHNGTNRSTGVLGHEVFRRETDRDKQGAAFTLRLAQKELVRHPATRQSLQSRPMSATVSTSPSRSTITRIPGISRSKISIDDSDFFGNVLDDGYMTDTDGLQQSQRHMYRPVTPSSFGSSGGARSPQNNHKLWGNSEETIKTPETLTGLSKFLQTSTTNKARTGSADSSRRDGGTHPYRGVKRPESRDRVRVESNSNNVRSICRGSNWKNNVKIGNQYSKYSSDKSVLFKMSKLSPDQSQKKNVEAGEKTEQKKSPNLVIPT